MESRVSKECIEFLKFLRGTGVRARTGGVGMVEEWADVAAVEKVETASEAPRIGKGGRLTKGTKEKGLKEKQELPEWVRRGFARRQIVEGVVGRERGFGEGAEEEVGRSVGKDSVRILEVRIEVVAKRRRGQVKRVEPGKGGGPVGVGKEVGKKGRVGDGARGAVDAVGVSC